MREFQLVCVSLHIVLVLDIKIFNLNSQYVHTSDLKCNARNYRRSLAEC